MDPMCDGVYGCNCAPGVFGTSLNEGHSFTNPCLPNQPS